MILRKWKTSKQLLKEYKQESESIQYWVRDFVEKLAWFGERLETLESTIEAIAKHQGLKIKTGITITKRRKK